MRNWTNFMLGTIAVIGMATTACGGGDKGDKPAASAEPAKETAAPPPPPPPAATQSAAPAPPPPPPETAAPPPPEPSGDSSAAPEGSGHAGHKGKHAKGEKGEHAGKGEKGGKGRGEKGAKAGDDDKSDKVIKLHHAKMEFNHPGHDWKETKKAGWTLLHPPNRTSVLGFVEFDKPGESTSRIGQIASNLELTNINWKGSGDDKHIGPQHLKAHHAEGTCKVATNKHDCEIEYYTVEGALLIVYAFETDVKGAAKKEKLATRTVQTLRRY